jgi:isoleucyl-tRNA synthetase
VDKGLEEYKLTESARAMNDFVDELSNWYVRRSRERFWVSDMPQDKINAYMTLYTVLVTMTKLSAAFTPFMAESMYTNLVKNLDKTAPESVHLCDFPVANDAWIDAELEKNMDFVLDVVVAGRAARNTANIKNRQPIGLMYVKAEDYQLPEMYQSIISEELNIKEVKFTDDVEGFTTYKFKPQLKTLGPKYGKILPKISAKLNEFDGNDLMRQFNAGNVVFDIEGQEVTLALADVLVESAQKEGFAAEKGKLATAILDTNLTPELIEEGFVREVISKIQTMRKEADFDVLDKIKITYATTDALSEVIHRNAEEIKSETLANALVSETPVGFVKDWNINGEKAVFGVERL